MNDLESETKLVSIRNYVFTKPRPMGNNLYPPSAPTRILVFAIDPSAYDQVIEYDEAGGHGPSFKSFLAAEKTFAALCSSNDHDGQSMMLVFNCTDTFKIKLTMTPFQYCYPEYVADRSYASVKDFLERRFGARRASPHTAILTWFIEEGDTGGTQQMRTRMMKHIEKYHESMSVHV